MRNGIFTLLVLVNGLVLGLLGGLVLWDHGEGQTEEPYRYLLDRSGGNPGFFDQVTGRYITFQQHENFWFVMIYDPKDGSVTYKETRLIEDPAFLKAAERLKSEIPKQLGRDLRLDVLRE